MPRVSIEELPDHGRLWIFPAARELTERESEVLLAEVDDFLETWSAHGVPLRSGRELREGRFLLVGVDVDAEAPSGCSIDALVNRLRALGSELGTNLIEHAPVWYREGDRIRSVSRADFRGLVAEGAVGPEVNVVDTTLTSLAQLRRGELEQPATDTWHGRAFFKGQVPA